MFPLILLKSDTHKRPFQPKRKTNEMKTTKPLVLLSILSIGIQFSSVVSVEAKIFKNRNQRRNSSSVTRRNVTRKTFGHRISARHAEREQRAIARLGIEKYEKKKAFWNTVATLAAGAAEGVSSSASSWNYTSPTSSYSLPSNFSNQMQMNSFNRSYSTNPSHAPVYGR